MKLVPLQAITFAGADTLGDIGPCHGTAFVTIARVHGREEISHLSRVKSMFRLENGRHRLALTLVHGLIWLPDVFHGRLVPLPASPGASFLAGLPSIPCPGEQKARQAVCLITGWD